MSARFRSWPDEVASMGARRSGQPFSLCSACPPSAHPQHAGTFVVYGRTPLCRACAQALARGSDVEFVQEALARVRGAQGSQQGR